MKAMARPVDEDAAADALREFRDAHTRMREAEEVRRLAKQERAAALEAAMSAGLTLREIGRRVGLSHERVRQMIHDADNAG